MKALFLSHEHALSAGGGGQQQCTREYGETLREAGFDLANVTFATDRSWGARLRRKLRPAPYSDLIPGDFLDRVDAAVAAVQPEFVFCNLYNFVPLGPSLRALLPAKSRLVLLSHGLASVDEVHAVRIAAAEGSRGGRGAQPDRRVGAMLRAESRGLPAFDHVFCLAAFEVEICRWLGARSVSWLPRTIDRSALLPWKPSGDRIGCVGTFDHPPNLEGLRLFCAALAAAGPGKLRLRLVSRSNQVASELASRYPFIDYLGPLESRAAVEAEVSSWSGFVHPIFCHAMGCSTKIATGMGWGLPVLTTGAGLRGYAWKDGEIPLASTAPELAALALGALEPARSAALREGVLRAVATSPTQPEVASQVRRDLGVR